MIGVPRETSVTFEWQKYHRNESTFFVRRQRVSRDGSVMNLSVCASLACLPGILVIVENVLI